MELHLSTEKSMQLSQLAERIGRDAESVLEEAVDRLLEEDRQFRAAVEEGLTALDKGEFIEHDEVRARIERLFQS